MRAVVVKDEVHVQVGGNVRLDRIEERAKLDRAMPRVHGGEHRPRLDVEGGKQGGRPVTPIVMGPPLGLAGLHRQQGRRPIQRLNLPPESATFRPHRGRGRGPAD